VKSLPARSPQPPFGAMRLSGLEPLVIP
jgi:hypothetical protein